MSIDDTRGQALERLQKSQGKKQEPTPGDLWIAFFGKPSVTDSEDKPASDEAVRCLDGARADTGGDVFADYLEDETLKEIVSGGDLVLRVRGAEVVVETRYRCAREFTDAEVLRVFEHTAGQWADGIGEGDVWAQTPGPAIVGTWNGGDWFETCASWAPEPRALEWPLDLASRTRTPRFKSAR